MLLLIRSSDIETKPGPKKQSCLKFFHRNLNELAAHGFTKPQLIETYNATNSFDIVRLSETFLDSIIPSDHNRINVAGCSLLKADHPSNTKSEGVCIYYKDCLPLIKKYYVTDLKECLVTEITVDNEKCSFTCLHRSPRQNCGQFSDFCKDFSTLHNNINDQRPSCCVIVCDFNAKCSKWYPLDKHNAAGETLQTYATTARYSQLINKPTHCVNGSSSCINLIFTSYTNLVTDFGVDPTLYKTYHHNLIFEKINFNIPLPPPFYRDIWDYERVNAEIIQKSNSKL